MFLLPPNLRMNHPIFSFSLKTGDTDLHVTDKGRIWPRGPSWGEDPQFKEEKKTNEFFI